MTRTVYLVDHDFPPTEDDLAAAALAGAAEVICGMPEALARAGIDSFGYHEIAEPPAPDPSAEPVPMWRVRVILAMDGIEDAVDAAVSGLPDSDQTRGIKARWMGRSPAPNFVPGSDLVQGMVATLGPTLGLDQAAVDSILARARALTE